MAFSTFVRFAEDNDYRPWKELARYDGNMSYTKDNMYFTYSTKPNKTEIGFHRKEGEVRTPAEHLHMLRYLGCLTLEYEATSNKVQQYLEKFGQDFDMEALQTISSYLLELRRCATNCLAYLDELSIDEKIIAPNKKVDEKRKGSFKVESVVPTVEDKSSELFCSIENSIPSFVDEATDYTIE